MSEVSPDGPRVDGPGPRRFPGRPFALAFGAFLVLATILFAYFAQRAEISRRVAIEQMQRDGLLPTPAPE